MYYYQASYMLTKTGQIFKTGNAGVSHEEPVSIDKAKDLLSAVFGDRTSYDAAVILNLQKIDKETFEQYYPS